MPIEASVAQSTCSSCSILPLPETMMNFTSGQLISFLPRKLSSRTERCRETDRSRHERQHTEPECMPGQETTLRQPEISIASLSVGISCFTGLWATACVVCAIRFVPSFGIDQKENQSHVTGLSYRTFRRLF